VTPLAFLVVLISDSCGLAGQIFFKHAMGGREGNKGTMLTAGIAVKAVGFFLWVGLLSRYDLSFLYPFEGLQGVVLMFAASIFLKEKMTLNLWMGVALISAGIMLVSRS